MEYSSDGQFFNLFLFVGLLILVVLLVLGLVLLVVPLATRLSASSGGHSTAHSPLLLPRPAHLSLSWTRQLLGHQLAVSGNVVVSPGGLLASISALSVGAAGPTKTLLVTALAETLREKAAPLPVSVNTSRLLVINKLFVQNGPRIEPNFVAQAAGLGLSVEQVDINERSGLFEEKLSTWLRAVSSGRLERFQLDSSVIHRPAQLVLLSAYHVPALLSGFSRVLDQQIIFKPFAASAATTVLSRPVNFITRVGSVGVASFEAGSVTAVELELANSPQYAFISVLLPAFSSISEADLMSLLGRLEAGGFLNLDRYQRTALSVQLPIWRQEQTVDLLAALPDLGLAEALTSDQADLSGLAAGLKLTDLRQRITFELLEVGRNLGLGQSKMLIVE